jgi:deoxyadenosine/deoxycytidine kinase
MLSEMRDCVLLMSKEIEHAYISLSGLIGAGKSTLARALGEALAMDVYYEPVEDNVYLEDFYRDMKSCAFAMQIWLLNRRFEQQ